MELIDALLSIEIQNVFAEALRTRRGLHLSFRWGDDTASDDDGRAGGPDSDAEGEFPQVRIATLAGTDLLVTPRHLEREAPPGSPRGLHVEYEDLVGYDWITEDTGGKVAAHEEHYDRLYLYTRGRRTHVLEDLGPAVYPLMTFLGRVVELRSQKVLLRRLDPEDVDLLGRALHAAAAGPFVEDREMPEFFGQDRASLQVVAHLWPRLNLAAPALREILESVVDFLIRRRERHPDAWDALVDARPEDLRAAYRAFAAIVR
ncbi:MAG: hypothetical protein D6701_13515 [Gemmatimonadetes bacterium]|nr:MAG: hypothetical protein D6701_13515 [Gemmatimonadota bacterium]